MNKRILITGANAGIGKDTARQLALKPETETIYLGCRNEVKAKIAKKELEQVTGKSVFEILLIDVSNLDSIRAAIERIDEPIDALIMNAGGMGGKNFFEKNADGVTQMFAVNMLGHAVLAEELLKANKIRNVVMYAGSEAARGVNKMGIKAPVLQSHSADEFAAIMDGSFFKKADIMNVYAHIKYVAALWMSALARRYPEVRIVTVSPGSTGGTNIMDDLSGAMKLMFKMVGSWMMPLIGMMHNVEKGARRYVDVLDNRIYKTGVFYASKKSALTGKLIDQSSISSDLNNQTYQENAYAAVHRFIKVNV